MISVIVDAGEGPERLAGLLAQLTAGAVEGLVREVFIVAPREGLVAELCEETGAETAVSLQAAAAAAKSERLMVLPAGFRFRDGWIEALRGFAGRTARVTGLTRPGGVLVERGRAVGDADLRRLRRQLGLLGPRIG